MTTSSQLPVTQDIELIHGVDNVVPVNFGLNLSMFGEGFVLVAEIDGNDHPISVSIVSAAAGAVTLAVPFAASRVVEDGALWRLIVFAASAEDPESLKRTLAWGRVSVVTPATVSPSSPLYHAVEMVAGDEFTFQVNLGMSLEGKSLFAHLWSIAGLIGNGSLALTTSVVSSASGIVKVTIDELQSFACLGAGSSWQLFDATSWSVLRAGPVTAYSADTASAAPSTPASSSPASVAAPPNLGSVVL